MQGGTGDVQKSRNDISVSHHMGGKRAGRPRPVVVKFTRRDSKFKMLTKKFKGSFKNVSIVVEKPLSPLRLRIMRVKVRAKHSVVCGYAKVRSCQKENRERKFVMTSPEDFLKLRWPDDKLRGKRAI